MTSTERRNPDLTGIEGLDLSTDVLYDVLSNPRRRFVIACLHRYGSPMALADLADELATWEHDAPITEIPASDVKSLYVALYHVHVPRLVDADVVGYDQERDTVASTETVDAIASRVPLPDVAGSKPTMETPD